VIIDTHCHLDFPDFEAERAEVVARARARGIGRMITISTRVRRFDAIRAIAEQFDDVFCSVGTHPNNAHEETDITAEDLVALSGHPKVVAIGEAGLDYHYDRAPHADQRAGLLVHIEASRRTQLPLVIHARQADDDMASILRDETAKGAFPFVLHCFSSGRALAETGVELGGYISFSGILTFRNSPEIREIAAAVPEERLLVETDAPYLAPVPHRGQTNEPSYVADTLAVLASTRGTSTEQMATTTTENALRLFSKMSRP
jgi:TatD DNase family protein